MAALLSTFEQRKEELSPASHDLLLHLMTESHNPVRIGSGLPAGALVAHKSGTMPGVFNDAAIITSVDGKHHIVVVILTKKPATQDEEDTLQVVSQIARTAYDTFAR